jgi:hypothetical protein
MGDYAAAAAFKEAVCRSDRLDALDVRRHPFHDNLLRHESFGRSDTRRMGDSF